MKRNDIALIVLIVSVSLVVAYSLGEAILGQPQKHIKQVEVVEPISSNVTQPSQIIFNKDAINPAVPIKIGDPSNVQPFSLQ